MRDKTCCFTGHREIDVKNYTEIKKRTKDMIVALIEKGVLFFAAGGAKGFDTLAAETVLELKEGYAQIKLILILPYLSQTKGWDKDDICKYEIIKEKADEVVCMAEHYYRGCMQKRNRQLVDISKYCICYLMQNGGGTAYAVNYAKKKGLIIYNIA